MSRAADVDLTSSLASAAAGDEAAFARIVARYQQELFSIAVLVTRDRSLAEDAVQSAWAIAWRKLDTMPTRSRHPVASTPRPAWLASTCVPPSSSWIPTSAPCWNDIGVYAEATGEATLIDVAFCGNGADIEADETATVEQSGSAECPA